MHAASRDLFSHQTVRAFTGNIDAVIKVPTGIRHDSNIKLVNESPAADCTGHVVPGARPCALGTFSYLVSSTSYFRLSYPNRLL